MLCHNPNRHHNNHPLYHFYYSIYHRHPNSWDLLCVDWNGRFGCDCYRNILQFNSPLTVVTSTITSTTTTTTVIPTTTVVDIPVQVCYSKTILTRTLRVLRNPRLLRLLRRLQNILMHFGRLCKSIYLTGVQLWEESCILWATMQQHLSSMRSTSACPIA